MQPARRISLGIFILASGLGAAGAVDAASERPNIVFVLVDDLGWSDLSTGRTNFDHPSSFHETPALERLAQGGMCFTSAYVNGPTCSPARAAILTGQYPLRATNNIYQVSSLNRGGDQTLLVGPRQGIAAGEGQPASERLAQLAPEALTVAETLASAGYRTAHIGKYHVGGGLANNGPQQQGFQYVVGRPGRGSPPRGYRAEFEHGTWSFSLGAELDPFSAPYTQEYVDRWIEPFSHGVSGPALEQLVGTPKHLTDALTDAAVDWIRANHDRPFYLQLHPFAVHTPTDAAQARPDLLAKYRRKTPVDDDADGAEPPAYAALIEGLDQSVARVVDCLRSTPDPRSPGSSLAANTLVVVLSDNGGKQPEAYHGPLKGWKGELDEGGIRVPLIVWSENPRLVQAGTINPTPVMGIDFHPTFAHYAGASTEGLFLDGVNLAASFADATSALPRTALFWHLPGYVRSPGRDQRPQSAIRKGAYKLLYSYEEELWELYDLAHDLGERSNLADTLPDLRDELGGDLVGWLEALDAPLPTYRTSTRYPDGTTFEAGAEVRLPRPGVSLGAPERLPAAHEIRATAAELHPGRLDLLERLAGAALFSDWGVLFYSDPRGSTPYAAGASWLGSEPRHFNPPRRVDGTGEIQRPVDVARRHPSGVPESPTSGVSLSLQLLYREVSAVGTRFIKSESAWAWVLR